MSPDPSPPTTRVCVLTPEGRGAIAVVRVWGPRALEVADAAFRPRLGRPLGQSEPGRLRVGRMGNGIGDEVVAVVIGAEGPDPEIEVHCHGGAAAAAMVLEALEAAGAERRQPVAWVRSDSRSAVEAEAAVDLARATTVRTAEILLEQQLGALEAAALRCLSLLGDDAGAALGEVARLLGRSAVGMRLVAGWRVVLAGRPNVGKSRLLNALAGYDRAIVDPAPGTTRDVVTVRTALDGWPVELSDTAGQRDSDDLLEASGIALGQARRRQADLVVVVLDRSEPLTEVDRTLLASHEEALVVVNKCDLPAAWIPDDPRWHAVSAERGDGIDLLASAMARRLVPDPPPPGSAVPFRPGQVRRLELAREAIVAGDAATAEVHLRAIIAPLPDRSRCGDL